MVAKKLRVTLIRYKALNAHDEILNKSIDDVIRSIDYIDSSLDAYDEYAYLCDSSLDQYNLEGLINGNDNTDSSY